jgi:L-2-hydroxyglutarate oxidase LhgO
MPKFTEETAAPAPPPNNAMEKTGIVIIGAGVVGLAIAERLSLRTGAIIVLERHDAFGRETSSRNSEVVHAGFYYPVSSLKAALCVEGNRLLYEFCAENGVPHKRCGKVVVARAPEDEKKIAHLFEQGGANNVPGLSLVDAEGITRLEPALRGRIGILSATTGIVDTHTFMKKLEQRAADRGVTHAYHCEAVGISHVNGSYEVAVKDADGSLLVLGCERVVNAAGLTADRVAALAGIDAAKAGYRIHYCKGEYFSVSNRHRGKLSRLVYPAPTTISLGIHGVLGLDGSFKLGPSAFYVDELDYDVDAAHRREFFEDARTLFPFLEEDDLSPAMAGIRPKLQEQGGAFRDFVIRDEADKGLPGLVNLIGIESPGLTSALSIARYVERLA